MRSRRRRIWLVLPLALALMLSTDGLASWSGSVKGVNFISLCRFSHRAPDDPIVYPGQPGVSHDHSFVGNTSTDASSTLASLRRARTTCRRPGDTAAYWMPTLSVGGRPVPPSGATIYYRRNALRKLRPFPAGLKMIAGDAQARRPQSVLVTYWDCGDLVNVPRSSDVPDCRDGTSLSLHVNFPDCWDAKSLLSDNQRHVRYSVNGRCPKGFPVSLPALSLVLRYPVTTADKPVELASGGQYSGHADFMNAWDQQALASLVASCLNRYRHCGTGA